MVIVPNGAFVFGWRLSGNVVPVCNVDVGSVFHASHQELLTYLALHF
jgi:hypothetical protein